MIDDYLDELAAVLRADPRRTRRILAETEDHLRQSVETLVAAGTAPAEAERLAIARFGSAQMVARRFDAVMGTRLWYLRAYIYAALLGGIVLLAAGIAGELSAGFGLAFGKAYVSGDINGASYTAARCADFFEYHPGAASCEQAATFHHFDEDWRNADLALVAGIILVAAHLLLRRRYARDEDERSFPRRMFWLTGMLGFGAVAPILVLYGTIAGLRNNWSGQAVFISGGLVAAIACLAFLRRGLRQLQAVTREYAA